MQPPGLRDEGDDMRIEIQDIASGQAIYSETMAATGETAHEIAMFTLANQNVADEPETIRVAVWIGNDMGDTEADIVLAGQS
jgi:hypothetical protein